MTTTIVPPRPFPQSAEALSTNGEVTLATELPPPRRQWIKPTLLYVLGALAVVNAAVSSVTYVSGPSPFETGSMRETWAEAAFHLVPGILFLLLGPLQFVTRLRTRFPKFHRVSGRVFVACTAFTGVSAVMLSLNTLEYGGVLLFSANLTFGVLMLVMLAMAVVAIVRGDVVKHRAYMVRTFAIGLASGTSRILFLPLFLIFGEPIPWTIGAGMWAAWGINLAVAEVFVLKRFRQ